MRISAKGRYGLGAMVYMAQKYASADQLTASHIADYLGISKIYLEQVFVLLKKAGLVSSTKGSQGGYRLVKSPIEINAYDILNAVELSLFEKPDKIVMEKAPFIENAISNVVLHYIDQSVSQSLKSISLSSLAEEANRLHSENNHMYYI